MKAAIVLMALGVLGMGQYGYFQLTSLAYRYEYYRYTEPGVPGDLIGVDVIRDWTVGIAGAIIGAILLGYGIYRLKRQRAR